MYGYIINVHIILYMVYVVYNNLRNKITKSITTICLYNNIMYNLFAEAKL